DDDLIVISDPSVASKVRRARETRGPLWTDEHSLGLAGNPHAPGDLLVGHRDRDALRLTKGAQDDEVAERLRDADTRRKCARVGPGFGLRAPIDERLDDRRASGGLDRDETGKLRAQPADRPQLVERFPHADETHPA